MKYQRVSNDAKRATKYNSGNKYTIIVLTNITLEHLFIPLVESQFNSSLVEVETLVIPFSEYDLEENVALMQQADLISVILDIETLYPDLENGIYARNKSIDEFYELCSQQSKILYDFIKLNSHSPIIWFGFEDYGSKIQIVRGTIPALGQLINLLNNQMADLLEVTDTFIDFKRIIARIGIGNAYDYKGRCRWNAPYSNVLLEEVSKELHKQYLIQCGITKKCIVLDCDNVLWGGILSEDGIENICLGGSGLGKEFQDFQRFLLSLYYHGVILTICSKNDLSDVMKMFKDHNEMILKEKYIACFQVNWDNKPQNIEQLALKLNIGLDSMVFIDDSDFEIQSVKSLLPDVTTIKYNRYTVYEKLECFNLKGNLDIDKVRQRNNTYKTNEQRKLLQEKHQSFEAYLQALDMNVDIHKALEVEINRIAELTQRTNKCTIGKRYTVNQLKQKLGKDNYDLYSVSISDKFSDLGLVGVIGIKNNNTLDLFSLSCRALGRSVEVKMREYIYTNYDIDRVDFVKTSSNQDMHKLFKEKIG